MLRFWDEASVRRDEAGFEVLLDGRPMRLPGGPSLRLRSAALAEAIAAEWREAGGAKGGEMSLDSVPLTRLAGTAQERVARDPGASIAALARYGEADLLCYRAERPAALVERQSRDWDPLLDWAATALDARLRVTVGVIHVAQPEPALAALTRALASLDANGLAGMGIAVPALGSLVLGLALARGRLDAAAAAALGTLDERHQIDAWGHDEEAARRLDLIAAEVALAGRFMALAAAP